MSVKLLTEHHLEFLSLKVGCTCSSESTHVKIPHCWKSLILSKYVVDIFDYLSAQNAFFINHIFYHVENSLLGLNIY